MSDRLTLVSSHGLARASARKRAYTHLETNTETITECHRGEVMPHDGQPQWTTGTGRGERL